MKTLLTDPSAEDLAKIEQERERLDRFRAVREAWESAYINGEVPLESLIRAVNKTCLMAGLSPHDREGWLGRSVRLALDASPPTGARSNSWPTELKNAAKGLARLVEMETPNLSRVPNRGKKVSESRTVFEEVAAIYSELGRRVSARMVEGWINESSALEEQ